MGKIVSDRMRHLYENIQDETIVKDLIKELYLHEMNYLEMIGVKVEDIEESQMNAIVENRVQFDDLIKQYVNILSDRQRINSGVEKSKKVNSKNRWA